VQSQGSTVGEDGSLRLRCHGEAARSVLVKVGHDVFALFHAVSANLRSKTQNSQFDLLGQILYAQSPPVQMAARVQKILDQPMYSATLRITSLSWL
jgi:hypothetical protein